MKFKIVVGLLIASLSLNAYFIYRKHRHSFDVMVLKVKSYVTGTDMKAPREITPAQAIDFYQIMKDAHEILTAHDIPYVICSGTLLGAVRHGGFIPWDDDLDLIVPIQFEKDLLQAFKDFEKIGYYITNDNMCYKAYITNPKTWKGTTHTPPSVDIFIMHDRGDGNYVMTRSEAQRLFSNEIYPVALLTQRQLIKFGDLMVFGPSSPETILDINYPKGWKDVAYLMGDHLTGTKVDKTKFQMKKYKPAKPFGPLKDRYKK